jgi:hypothetical protein
MFLVLFAAVAAVVTVLALTYALKASPPVDAVDRAHRALQEARAGGAARGTDRPFAAAEDSLRLSRRLIEEQNGRFWPLRDYTRANASARGALLQARRALIEAQCRDDSLKSAAGREIARASLEVRDLEQWISELPPKEVSRVGSARLQAELEVGRALRARGQYSEALRTAQTVLDSTAALRSRLQRRLNKYMELRGLWDDWTERAIRRSRDSKAVALVIRKLDHECDVYVNGRRVRSYPVDLGVRWLGDKVHRGDGKTPEGEYKVIERRGPGQTRFHRAYVLDYPNDADRARFRRARSAGLLASHAEIGGLIEIHGHGGRGIDWTEGCIALENEAIDELDRWVKIGTPVAIVGTSGR